jgi:hypothetical protein
MRDGSASHGYTMCIVTPVTSLNRQPSKHQDSTTSTLRCVYVYPTAPQTNRHQSPYNMSRLTLVVDVWRRASSSITDQLGSISGQLNTRSSLVLPRSYRQQITANKHSMQRHRPSADSGTELTRREISDIRQVDKNDAETQNLVLSITVEHTWAGFPTFRNHKSGESHQRPRATCWQVTVGSAPFFFC